MFVCLECGRKFKTTRAAERAAEKGCPGCGGSDIDLDTAKPLPPSTRTEAAPGIIVDYDDPPLRRRMLGSADSMDH